jgi:hypothetical protein
VKERASETRKCEATRKCEPYPKPSKCEPNPKPRPMGPLRNLVLTQSAACFPWFLSFGNRTQNSRVAGARTNHQPIGPGGSGTHPGDLGGAARAEHAGKGRGGRGGESGGRVL